MCSDFSFYVGFTNNLKRRLIEHNNGIGATCLKNKQPLKLVYFEKHEALTCAMRREKQLKGWSRQKKINLIKFGRPNGI